MLEGRTYVPLLHARLAEMRALRELASSTKDIIVPIVKIRPWLNSKSLSKVFDVISDAFGDRRFGLDLDDFKFEPNSIKPASIEFSKLFDQSNGYESYYNCVSERLNRIPVLRRAAGVTHFIDEQIEKVRELERGVFIKVSPFNPGDYLTLASVCEGEGVDNAVFVIDCGWRQDVLSLAASCVSIANSILDVSEEVEVVVAGSSFPDSFSGMGVRASFPVNERILFQNVRQNINRGRLVYGDWGSTRPPSDPVPMMNVPRVDVAKSAFWPSWRSEDGESYHDVAKRVVADPLWSGETALWGNYVISSTAQGIDPAIKAPAMAAAVRVNLHMHEQANFDNPAGVNIGDEPVGDDL